MRLGARGLRRSWARRSGPVFRRRRRRRALERLCHGLDRGNRDARRDVSAGGGEETLSPAGGPTGLRGPAALGGRRVAQRQRADRIRVAGGASQGGAPPVATTWRGWAPPGPAPGRARRGGAAPPRRSSALLRCYRGGGAPAARRTGGGARFPPAAGAGVTRAVHRAGLHGRVDPRERVPGGNPSTPVARGGADPDPPPRGERVECAAWWPNLLAAGGGRPSGGGLRAVPAVAPGREPMRRPGVAGSRPIPGAG